MDVLISFVNLICIGSVILLSLPINKYWLGESLYNTTVVESETGTRERGRERERQRQRQRELEERND